MAETRGEKRFYNSFSIHVITENCSFTPIAETEDYMKRERHATNIFH